MTSDARRSLLASVSGGSGTARPITKFQTRLPKPASSRGPMVRKLGSDGCAAWPRWYRVLVAAVNAPWAHEVLGATRRTSRHVELCLQDFLRGPSSSAVAVDYMLDLGT